MQPIGGGIAAAKKRLRRSGSAEKKMARKTAAAYGVIEAKCQRNGGNLAANRKAAPGGEMAAESGSS